MQNRTIVFPHFNILLTAPTLFQKLPHHNTNCWPLWANPMSYILKRGCSRGRNRISIFRIAAPSNWKKLWAPHTLSPNRWCTFCRMSSMWDDFFVLFCEQHIVSASRHVAMRDFNATSDNVCEAACLNSNIQSSIGSNNRQHKSRVSCALVHQLIAFVSHLHVLLLTSRGAFTQSNPCAFVCHV